MAGLGFEPTFQDSCSFHWFFSLYAVFPQEKRHKNATNYWETIQPLDAVYSGDKKLIIYFLPCCLSSQVVYLQCCFHPALRCKAGEGFGTAVPPQHWWARWVQCNKSTKWVPKAHGAPTLFWGGTCWTELFGCKHVFLLSRARLLQQAVSEIEVGPIYLLVKVDSQLMY